MNILVVDDDRENILNIQDLIEKNNELSNVKMFPEAEELDVVLQHIEDGTIEKGRNIVNFVNWLRKYILDKDIDILILDLALSSDEESARHKTQETSGIKIINSLVPDIENNDEEIAKINFLPIIVLTGKKTDKDYIDYSTRANIVHITSPGYAKKIEQFKVDLENRELAKIIKTQARKYSWLKSNSHEPDKKYDYDLAIICALEEEYQHIKNLPVIWEKKKINGTLYDTAIFNLDKNNSSKKNSIRVVAKVMMRMGMVEAATFSTKILNDCRPQYIAMSGIAAAIESSDLKLGDILIPEYVYNWQSGKFKIDKDSPIFDDDVKKLNLEKVVMDEVDNYINAISARKISLYADILEKYQDKYEDAGITTVPRIFKNEMVSGSAVVADRGIVKDYIEQRNVAGIDMEAYGVFYAAYSATKYGAEAIVIKGICDFANEDKDDSFHRFAGFASAQVLYGLFTKYISYQD